MTNHDGNAAYGVVALNSLGDWAFDEFFHNGENLTAENCLADFLDEWDANNPGNSEEREDAREDAIQEFWDGYYGEEEEYRIQTDTMILELSYLGGAPLVWVIKSPHTRMVQPCSPCCPGAGDLDSGEGSILAYDLPPEWYPDEE
jgi:hypothetical protein